MIKEEQRQSSFRRQVELEKKMGYFHKDYETNSFPQRRLSHPRYLKQELEQNGVVKVTQDEEITGVIIEPSLYENLLEYLAILDGRLEEESLNGVIDQRLETNNYSSGEELKKNALKYLEENEKTVRSYLNDNTD